MGNMQKSSTQTLSLLASVTAALDRISLSQITSQADQYVDDLEGLTE